MADPEVYETSGGIKKIREILEKTVTDRNNSLVFGTDYPECNQKAHVELIQTLNIPTLLKDLILRQNAAELFRI